jgi:nitroreductase
MLDEIIRKNRSYRRFDEKVSIPPATLRHWVDTARFVPQAGNLQPLRYVISASRERNGKVFECLKWAAYLKEWGGPVPGERPAAYIVMAGDPSVKKDCYTDAGIAAQTFMLQAAEAGYGGCMIASFNAAELRQVLEIPGDLQLLLVLALGKPVEKVVLEERQANGDLKYYRDADGVHHVPKRPLSEILLKEY